MDSKSLTRQERRAAKRKAEILEAAAKVFAEKGFHRATTKEIAEAADVAEGTIYNYFESKDDLLLSLIDRLADLRGRLELYDRMLDVDARQAFVTLISQRFSILQEQQAFLHAVLPEILSTPDLRERYRQQIMIPAMRDLEEHFQLRAERGQIDVANVPILVSLLGALGLGLEVMALLGDENIQTLWANPDRLTEEIAKMIFSGLLPLPDRRGQESG